MKNLVTRVIVTLMAIVLLSGTLTAAAASTYTDLAGSWAEDTLKKALNDSLIVGYDGRINPDSPITTAEAVTILCRALSADKKADLSAVSDVKAGDWYYDAAAKAVSLGILTPANGKLSMGANLTRGGAFCLLAEAFQLVPANQDETVLSGYTDNVTIWGEARRATEALVSQGYVVGFDHTLHTSNTITRAEFLTILYRIANRFTNSEALTGAVTGGAVYSKDTALSSMSFTGPLCFTALASKISLTNITAPELVLRSDNLTSLSLTGCKFDRVVFAAQGGDITYTPDQAAIGTIVIGTGSGKISISGYTPKLEVTGNNRDVSISGIAKSILVSGGSNKIQLEAGSNVTDLKILYHGQGNKLNVSGQLINLEVTGAGNSVEGFGKLENAVLNASDCKMTLLADKIKKQEPYGLDSVSLALNAPALLPAGQSLNATAVITAPAAGSVCTETWLLDNTPVQQNTITLDERTVSTYVHAFEYTKTLPPSVNLSYMITCITPDGDYEELHTEQTVALQNYDWAHYDEKERDRVLDLVTTGYRGDYTLDWAVANDYSARDKEIWVNAMEYSSPSNYLVWVNITYQRVNIFTGSEGKWKLDRTFIVGTGAPGKDTPTGTFSIIYKNQSGWTTDAYTVKPVVNFYSSAYGFHSRLYYPNTTTIEDDSIGYPVSHGCVRMYDEDIAWFYDNIPVGTTVAIY